MCVGAPRAAIRCAVRAERVSGGPAAAGAGAQGAVRRGSAQSAAGARGHALCLCTYYACSVVFYWLHRFMFALKYRLFYYLSVFLFVW
jgi:hypothetical protein